MESPISHSTIESFREHMAGAKEPIAGGVAVAAVCAGLGMALLGLTLKVASRRKDFSGDRGRLSKLLEAANKESVRLMRYADQDIVAYQQYRNSLKHRRGVSISLRRIIESPLQAAGSAARGVDICADAVTVVPLSVMSDLGAAATLLAGSVRAILLTVDVNLRQLPATSKLRCSAGKIRRELERAASRRVERLLKTVSLLIQRG
jgi:formiminotetrahydrofolate cyclodeaminase